MYRCLNAGGQPLPFDFRGTEAVFRDGLKTLRTVAEKASAIGQTRFYIWNWLRLSAPMPGGSRARSRVGCAPQCTPAGHDEGGGNGSQKGLASGAACAAAAG